MDIFRPHWTSSLFLMKSVLSEQTCNREGELTRTNVRIVQDYVQFKYIYDKTNPKQCINKYSTCFRAGADICVNPEKLFLSLPVRYWSVLRFLVLDNKRSGNIRNGSLTNGHVPQESSWKEVFLKWLAILENFNFVNQSNVSYRLKKNKK